jgi:hypothetical protein
MANTVSNVVAAKPLATGGVWVGPSGTALPTDATTALNVALKPTGYVGDGGLTETPNRTTDTRKAWGGDTVKILQTDFALTYTFTFIESLKTEVLQEVYGASNVVTTAATASTSTLQAVKIVSDTLPHRVFVFDMKDGNAKVRIGIPDGQIVDVGAVTYSDSDIVAYPVTVQTFFNSTLGAYAVKYSTDGVTV